MSDAGRAVADTDWHVDRLYDFLGEIGASVIAARYSRYVIDLNRPPDRRPLYPGASETELCPTTTFDDEPIYLPGQEPGRAEVEERRRRYWEPYHTGLTAEISRLRSEHGAVVLWDAHSIRSHVPRFFEGRLPDLNIGTGGGMSADPALIGAVAAEAASAEGFTQVLDGRFRGGYITRHYGNPATGVHSIQMELSQATYMEESPPWTFREDLAKEIRPVLRKLLKIARDWCSARATP
jgi:N-formylglutamate deformylase